MPEAALQPFVTSQRQTGVAGKATTTGLAKVWTWQADPNAANQAGPTATSATKPGCRPFNQQNKLGSYYCWNRVYDVHTARWTTPDPAMSPWWNLWAYAASSPTCLLDPTGLDPALKKIIEDMIKEEERRKKHEAAGVKKRDNPYDGVCEIGHKAEEIRRKREWWKGYNRSLEDQQYKLYELLKQACEKCASADCKKADCCDLLAKEIAKGITDAMYKRVKKSGQEVFGEKGNEKRGGHPVFGGGNDLYCNCGEWANETRNGATAIELDILAKCKDCMPDIWDMYRMKDATKKPEDDGGKHQKHNWTRICWGKCCVDVDPWETGTANGTVAGGNSDWHYARKGKEEKTKEWAEIFK